MILLWPARVVGTAGLRDYVEALLPGCLGALRPIEQHSSWLQQETIRLHPDVREGDSMQLVAWSLWSLMIPDRTTLITLGSFKGIPAVDEVG